ncbi:MAG TPA: DUF2975 domain-containing protein [Agriterribacter sp.]|nr:DUF2975 domain-containing protein [Agriterribacter sp.]
MKPRLILSFLKVATSILMWLLIGFTAFVLVASILAIADSNAAQPKMGLKANPYEVLAFEGAPEALPYTYATDSVVSYQQVVNRYKVQVSPHSAMGYYSMVMALIFMGLGIAVLWNFKKIFSETNLDDPFKHNIPRRLKILAVLFIVSDVLKLINYFLFNSFLHQSIINPRFQLITDTGSGIITGLIIWIIAVVYHRGIELQQENALTV